MSSVEFNPKTGYCYGYDSNTFFHGAMFKVGNKQLFIRAEVEVSGKEYLAVFVLTDGKFGKEITELV